MRARVTPGATVGGEVRVPGDKSISHRWLLMAATANGSSRLEGVPRSFDTLSTATCLAMLVPAARPALEAWASSPSVAGERHGSTWNRDASTLDLDTLDLQGEGRRSLRRPTHELNCGNSGTTMRLVAGLASSSLFETVLRGDASLASRPMERVAKPHRAMGADVTTEDGHPPLTIRGSELRGIRFEPEVPSAQVKTAVLFAGLYADRGPTTVVEPLPSRDHTERLLPALGARVRRAGHEVSVWPVDRLAPLDLQIPGDFSAAAPFIVAAALVPGSRARIHGVNVNPTRTGLLDVLERMGVGIALFNRRKEGGEPVGDLEVRSPERDLRAAEIGREEVPRMVDELPLFALAAGLARGVSVVRGAEELRVKETDRIETVTEGLHAVGIRIEAHRDGFRIRGVPNRPTGGRIDAHGDHRIAMLGAVAGLVSRDGVELEGADTVAISFPGFFELLDSVVRR